MKTALPERLPEIDSCTLAVFLSVLVGVAAIADGTFSALALVLVALALSGFLIGIRPRHGGRLRIEAPTVGALSILAAGAILFFEAPAEVAPFRALVLGLSATPLWWIHRTSVPAGMGARA